MNESMEMNEENNPKQTPGGKCLMNGNETGIPFSKENQPDPELKKKGWAKRRALKRLLNISSPGVLGTNRTDYAQLASDFLGIPKEEITIAVIMHFRQMEKAILKGDTYAYEAVLNRALGKPAQALTGANGKDLPIGPTEIKINIVGDNVPIAENEHEVK